MPIQVGCACGKWISVPDQFAGKTGKCKACGAPIAIPQALPDVVVALAEPDESPSDTPDIGPIVTEPESDSFSAIRAARTGGVLYSPIGPEPWYYRFLAGYAKAIIGIGIVVAVLLAVPSALGIVRAISDQEPSLVLASLALLAPAGAVLLASLIAGAPILLIVDAVRHLRMLRIESQHR
jgi:hypothetical protein